MIKTRVLMMILFCAAGFISTEVKAQATLSKDYLSLFNKAKTPAKPFGKAAFAPFTFNKPSKNSMILPLDNMGCVLPPSDIKYHIQLVNPVVGKQNYVNIPNAVPKIEILN